MCLQSGASEAIRTIMGRVLCRRIPRRVERVRKAQTNLIRSIYALTFLPGIDNLLFEFGERDLYQYWTDEVEFPPVLSHGIMRYWEQLFEAADAIRQVHHMDVTRDAVL